MKEKDYYAPIKKYYTQHAISSMAVEAKITKTNNLNFNCLMLHQEEGLLNAERCLAFKEADVGPARKNFDITVLYKATSVLIAIYYIPHKTEIYEIPIRSFLKEKYESNKKSLSKERAREIGKQIFI